MIELKQAIATEIGQFVAMEQLQNTADFIMPYPAEKHLAEMTKDTVHYLSIYQNELLAGFMILVEDKPKEIEFRRIVVAHKGQGLGQRAMQLMEEYCLNELNASRIWLDVFATNQVGRHIYQKLGYCEFDATEIDTTEVNGKRLLFMQKWL
ncbi:MULTISPECIES: GNAT family N-acetyltransferase [Shewanella]|uniref:GNAT family N-acetyltransferase n=1 Tax=Shewanella TaxID=22 RepID=UPI00143197A1|nr:MULTISPECIES: GNAT family N-acetyltransferase [Shewanella]MDC8854004.1 GNAT family N-acetyltransferase [Shewanella algae]NJI84885.1 GNAT family N-acetyltransferase [Shewanella sp. Iso12]